MAYQSVTVIIPPTMSDEDDCYGDVVEYVAACTGFDCKCNDLNNGDCTSCDAYFKDDKGNLWHGQMCYPSYPDGSQKYIVDLEKAVGEQE